MSKICNCPKCNSAGLSVAAINAKETQESKKDGTISGAGVGVGANGVSLLGGVGGYDETSETITKRAKNFTMPTPEYVPNIYFLFFCMGFVLSIIVIPIILINRHYLNGSISDTSLTSSFQYGMNQFTNDNTVLYSLILTFCLSIPGMVIFYKALGKNEKIHNEEMPKLKARYRELYYCEYCHLIFDSKGNKKNGDEDGFEKMMKIPADNESLLLFQEI